MVFMINKELAEILGGFLAVADFVRDTPNINNDLLREKLINLLEEYEQYENNSHSVS